MAKEIQKPSGYQRPEWLKQKRQSLETLKKSVEKMKEDSKKRKEARKRARAKQDICFWMDNAVFPFLDGIAESFHEPLIDGVKRLIKEKKNPFRPKKGWDRTRETEIALQGFLSQPQTKMLQILAKPFLKHKMEWIHRESEWIREEILKEEYADFYETIMETKGGKQWLDDLITDLTKYIKRLVR